MIKRIAHVCLSSTDLAASERFYCEQLGFEKVFRFTKDGREVGFYCRVAPNSFIEIFEEDRIDQRMPGVKHFCLEVDDLDGWIAKLREAGVTITDKKRGCDQSWQAWTEDPSGVRFEFHQYTDASSQFTGVDREAAWR